MVFRGHVGYRLEAGNAAGVVPNDGEILRSAGHKGKQKPV